MVIINPISTEKPVKELNDTIVPNVDKLSRSIIDSRGLARALTGDIEGAIADFQVYVKQVIMSIPHDRHHAPFWIQGLFL